jgi:hypothetical protein
LKFIQQALSKNLELTNNPIDEDRRLIMRLTPYFQIERQQAVEEGIERRKLGEILVNLRERTSQLSVEKLESLSDALFDFNEVSDLENWLNSIVK